MIKLVEFDVGDVAPLHNKALCSFDYCFNCGHKLGKNPWLFEVDTSWTLIDPTIKNLGNSNSQGCFPIGVECAKKFNPRLLVKNAS